jgi:uncharacterized protein YkwD
LPTGVRERGFRQSLALLGVLWWLLISAPAASGASACADDQLQPAPDTMTRVEAAIACRLNVERELNGQAAFRRTADLDRSARFQTGDMVSHHYFAEQAKGRPTLYTRILGSGYFSGAIAGLYAENIGTGPLQRATADGLVTAWMASPAHRDNILDPRLHDIGIGSVITGPDPAFYSNYSAAVYTTDFGWRALPASRQSRRRATCPRPALRHRSRTVTPRRGYCPRTPRRHN